MPQEAAIEDGQGKPGQEKSAQGQNILNSGIWMEVARQFVESVVSDLVDYQKVLIQV